MTSIHVTAILLGVGFLLVLTFAVAGLFSPTMRRRLQVPAARMVELDHDRWGEARARRQVASRTPRADRSEREDS